MRAVHRASRRRAAIAAELMGTASVRLYHDHVLVKEPGTQPAHAVAPGPAVLQRRRPAERSACGSPSIRSPRESTLEFVAGIPPRALVHAAARSSTARPSGSPTASLAELPDIDADPERFRVIGWALEPGDAVFFHMLTLHAAGGVSGTDRRRVLSVRFLGDDMVHAPRPWTTSPPFPGLDDELADGAPMDHPLFPVLWTGTRTLVP